jgi:hypothetical protein
MYSLLSLIATSALFAMSSASTRTGANQQTVAKFLSQTTPQCTDPKRVSNITANFHGTATNNGCGKLTLLDSGASTVWNSGIFTQSNNCTVLLNVSGNSNQIITPSFTCTGNASVVVNIRGQNNVLTRLTVNAADNSLTTINIDGSYNTFTDYVLASS